MTRPDLVIFDCNDVLVDSEPVTSAITGLVRDNSQWRQLPVPKRSKAWVCAAWANRTTAPRMRHTEYAIGNRPVILAGRTTPFRRKKRSDYHPFFSVESRGLDVIAQIKSRHVPCHFR